MEINVWGSIEVVVGGYSERLDRERTIIGGGDVDSRNRVGRRWSNRYEWGVVKNACKISIGIKQRRKHVSEF